MSESNSEGGLEKTNATDYKNRPQESVYLNVARWKLYIQNWNFSVSWEEGQEEHQQVPDKLYRLVSKPEEETAVLAVAVAQVAISDSEYAIISSQYNAIRGHSGVDVT